MDGFLLGYYGKHLGHKVWNVSTESAEMTHKVSFPTCRPVEMIPADSSSTN
jgi:hypothetical protein